MMSKIFRIEGKIDKLIDLLTSLNIKGEKKTIFRFKKKTMFHVKFFVGISDE